MSWKLPVFFLFICYSLSSQARDIEFTWQAFPEATLYQLQVAEKRNFKKIMVDKKTELPQVKAELPMGLYYYRVRAYDEKKRPGIWSKPVLVTVTPYPPKPILPEKGAKFNYFEKKNLIQFEWEKQEGKVRYDLLIQKTNGETVLEKRVKGNKVTIDSLEAGDYVWKVRARFQKKLITNYSESNFIFITKTPLIDPQLIEPKDGGELPAFRDHEFKWKKDAVAKFTDVEIRRLDNKNDKIKPLMNREGETTDLPALLPGDYKWRIRTKEEKDSQGKISSWAKFKTSASVLTGDNHLFRFRTGYATNNYNYESTRTNGYSGTGSDSSFFVDLYTRLQITRGFALSFDVMETEYEINSNKVDFNKNSLLMEFRFGENEFQQSSIIGYRSEEQYDFISGSPQKISTQGLVLGLTMDGYFSGGNSKLRIGLLYYKPKVFLQGGGDMVADVYEARIGYSYNIFERFWLEYEFAYDKYIFRFDESGAGFVTRWTHDISAPANIALTYEY